MTNDYVRSLRVKAYRLDTMLLDAKKKGDRGIIELVEEYLDDVLVELKEAKHMAEVTN